MLELSDLVAFVATSDVEHARAFYESTLGLRLPPSGGRIAWFRDPDGNLLSVTEFS